MMALREPKFFTPRSLCCNC